MLPDCVRQEFEDYLKYRRLEHGFLRLRCDTCHAEHLVAFIEDGATTTIATGSSGRRCGTRIVEDTAASRRIFFSPVCQAEKL